VVALLSRQATTNIVQIAVAKTDQEIAACYPVMAELRPHLEKAEFVETITRLSKLHNFSLIYLTEGGAIKAVAGIRIAEWLYTGRYLEIEDLITSADARSTGYGGQLFDWICADAKRQGCAQVRLVSGVQRKDAHRFYERKGMKFEAHYYSLNL
jgi:GNAT superfamily N-acetyltransferase